MGPNINGYGVFNSHRRTPAKPPPAGVNATLNKLPRAM